VPRERARDELVRLVLVPGPADFTVAVDLAGGAVGRGAWVHGRYACLEGAARRGLARAARGRVDVDVGRLGAAITAAAERRVLGLLSAARRSGQLAVGSTAVEQALGHGRVSLLLVAQDATAAAASTAVREAIGHGRAAVWGTRASLGELARGQGSVVGVIGVLSESIAAATRQAMALAHGFEAPPHRAGTGRETGGRASLGEGRSPSVEDVRRARRPASH
jgi:predicted RNA-binding protein YlxR (DUF448 family)